MNNLACEGYTDIKECVYMRRQIPSGLSSSPEEFHVIFGWDDKMETDKTSIFQHSLPLACMVLKADPVIFNHELSNRGKGRGYDNHKQNWEKRRNKNLTEDVKTYRYKTKPCTTYTPVWPTSIVDSRQNNDVINWGEFNTNFYTWKSYCKAIVPIV